MSYDAVMSDVEMCSVEGCETVAKTVGLCNNHYMAQYRETQRSLDREAAEIESQHGSPDEWDCDITACSEPAVVLFAEDGDVANAQALCEEHRMDIVRGYRLNLRRLGER